MGNGRFRIVPVVNLTDLLSIALLHSSKELNLVFVVSCPLPKLVEPFEPTLDVRLYSGIKLSISANQYFSEFPSTFTKALIDF